MHLLSSSLTCLITPSSNYSLVWQVTPVQGQMQFQSVTVVYWLICWCHHASKLYTIPNLNRHLEEVAKRGIFGTYSSASPNSKALYLNTSSGCLWGKRPWIRTHYRVQSQRRVIAAILISLFQASGVLEGPPPVTLSSGTAVLSGYGPKEGGGCRSHPQKTSLRL